MGITLMEALEKAGYPREQMFNHNSDLYVFVTPVTTRVINDWCVAEGISKEVFLETFKDNITGRPMYSLLQHRNLQILYFRIPEQRYG